MRQCIFGCAVLLCMHVAVVVCRCWLKAVTSSMGTGGTPWQVALAWLPGAWQRMVVGEGGMPTGG